jgi:hypothetical protein
MPRITPQNAAGPRAEDRPSRIIPAGIIGALIALVAWGVTHPASPPSERLEPCGPGAGLPCRFVRADGVAMVRTLHPERGVEVLTAADFDEGYRDWQEEMAPGCPGVGPMTAC